MDDIFLAYTAGFFDADGSVGVYPKARPRHSRGIQFQLQVKITQKHWMPILVEWKAAWGGSCCQSSSKTGRQWWDWSLLANDAASFLKDIYPYLRNKRKQAKLAIEFQSRIRLRVGQRRSKSEFDWQRMMSDLIKQLKQQSQPIPPELLAEKHRLQSVMDAQLSLW